jgi:DNA excision repair protein ERCC-4
VQGVVQSADGSEPLVLCQSAEAMRLLLELRPRQVILFEPELATIRQLEVYAACTAPHTHAPPHAPPEGQPQDEELPEANAAHGDQGVEAGSKSPGRGDGADSMAASMAASMGPPQQLLPPVRVHMCLFDASVEEQRFLSSLRIERDAFRRLIEERRSMVLPTMDEAEPDLADAHVRAAAHGGVYSSQPRIIVDVREFRSSLPAQLHRSGVELVPTTLEVGDYILSPELCVERKSLSDLTESFKSGRLHHQVETMCRHYKEPLLLIELDPNRPFLLQHPSELQGDIAPGALTSKLSLLLLHFPQLRLIWAHGSASTVAHFLGLKHKRDQPDVQAAVAAGQATEATGADGSSGSLSLVAQDMLRRMPGVNAHNVHKLMRAAGSLRGLAQMSAVQLREAVGQQCARQITSFLDTAPTEEA